MNIKRILVVDDEKDICEFFRGYLMRHGYVVDIAFDGLEGKELVETNCYDYIFLDCNMPGLTGVELMKIVKEHNPLAKKIMITGYEPITEEFAKDIGIDVFLGKPISMEDIEKVLK